MFLGRALSRSIILRVVGIHAVSNRTEAQLAAQRLHRGKQLVLAVEAPVRIVARVLGLVQLLVSTTCSGIPSDCAKAQACSMSFRARLAESASTASILSPRTRCAVAARNAESTPPE